jgi:hypothetical protein
MKYAIIMQISLLQTIKDMTPRQFAFIIGAVYTVTVAIVLTPGLLPPDIANIISRMQNAATVSYIAYVARYPFIPNRPADAKTRASDTTTTGAP